ncbi:MAG: excinuclease ABC subunit UvrA [Bacteroidota bacterium]|nr:excinuclease ABC subunit UvrA [Bacteroidota bacterium]
MAKTAQNKSKTKSNSSKKPLKSELPFPENAIGTESPSVSALENLIIRGARVHNLKNIDIDIPREKLVVITGISGSGKSSLAFDTIYAEGQRRYVESLSAYARQFLDMMERPDVDIIEGLSPAISIEQKTIGASPRSTVGTVTEIYDFIRLLFARLGTQFCVECNIPVVRQTADQIITAIRSHPQDSKLTILAPLVRARKGHYREVFSDALRQGFTKVRVDGEMKDLYEGLQVDRYKVHTIELVIDRFPLGDQFLERLTNSVNTALKMGKGILSVIIEDAKTSAISELLMSEKYSCPNCGRSYEEPQPNTFSFNSAIGACALCHGLGETRDFDETLVIGDKTKSIEDGGLLPLGKKRKNWLWAQVESVFQAYKTPLDTPVEKISPKLFDILIHGSGDEKLTVKWQSDAGRDVSYQMRFVGLMETLKQATARDATESMKEWAQQFMSSHPCPSCRGGRLKPESLAIRIGEYNIHKVVTLDLRKSRAFFETLSFEGNRQAVAAPILREITSRLDFLLDVGLNYLSLDRPARTLSGGESQRIRLATQIGTQLVGVLYILDEPSIGLHQRDNDRLIKSLEHLRDLGNTVIVVEHDKEMMLAADIIADIGPGAGEYGGTLVAYGPPQLFLHHTRHSQVEKEFISASSPTAEYLSGKDTFVVPAERNINKKQNHLLLLGAKGNNLKDVTLDLPIGAFTCITGVSGSGKSTIITETLAPILSKHVYNSTGMPLPYKGMHGLEYIDKFIEIDQTPIGRTPRSNPATYTGLFTMIRDFFAELPEAKIRGYKVGRFSFNVKGGRCETCQGAGMKKIEMNFLPDVYVTCETCGGRRYNRETLEVHFKGKSISDVLNMSVIESQELFTDIPRIKRKIDALANVGLGYIRLGQQAPTLSGGEAQRVKLATELSKVATGRTLYILDEPTTGLHFKDIRHLLDVLLELRNRGNTVVVIEHNLDVIKMADWVIDLGPEGGETGGYIVDQGTPEDLASRFEKTGSHTGKYLRKELTTPQ